MNAKLKQFFTMLIALIVILGTLFVAYKIAISLIEFINILNK